jgi:hypothetical protein
VENVITKRDYMAITQISVNKLNPAKMSKVQIFVAYLEKLIYSHITTSKVCPAITSVFSTHVEIMLHKK